MGTGNHDEGARDARATSTPVHRRSVVRGGLGAVLAGSLAGCQSLLGSSSDAAATESATDASATDTDNDEDSQAGDAVFADDWEDGSRDGWTLYADSGNAEASVVSIGTPSGGSRVLRLSEYAGDETRVILGTETAFSGWDGAWTIRTAFQTTALDPTAASQTYDILPAYDPTVGDDFSLSFRLGFRDSGGRVLPTGFYGDSVERGGTATFDWDEGRWYQVALSHDGDGSVRGTVWPSDSERPSSPTVEATVAVPSSGSLPVAMHVDGRQYFPLQLSHSFIRLSGDLSRAGDN